MQVKSESAKKKKMRTVWRVHTNALREGVGMIFESTLCEYRQCDIRGYIMICEWAYECCSKGRCAVTVHNNAMRVGI